MSLNNQRKTILLFNGIWENKTTSAYLNPIVSAVTKLGKQAVSLAAGPRIPLGGPEATMADWGLRAALTLAFPK